MYLIELYNEGVRTPVAIGKHIKHCYSFGLFVGQVAEPNQTYKISIKQIKIEGQAIVWDRSRFETVEHALYSPVGSYIRIRPVKLLKK